MAWVHVKVSCFLTFKSQTQSGMIKQMNKFVQFHLYHWCGCTNLYFYIVWVAHLWLGNGYTFGQKIGVQICTPIGHTSSQSENQEIMINCAR